MPSSDDIDFTALTHFGPSQYHRLASSKLPLLFQSEAARPSLILPDFGLPLRAGGTAHTSLVTCSRTLYLPYPYPDIPFLDRQ